MVVTKGIKRARKMAGVKPRTIRYFKRRANRVDRRSCRIALKQGWDYNSIPRLTERDIW